jgi:hypothetical protein
MSKEANRDLVQESIDRFEDFRDTHERLSASFRNVDDVSADAVLNAAAILYQTEMLCCEIGGEPLRRYLSPEQIAMRERMRTDPDYVPPKVVEKFA